MKILVATKQEYELAKKYLPDFDIVRTGVGASNVIHVCSLLDSREKVVNIGFAGSNFLPKGTVTPVFRSFRQLEGHMDGVIEEDYRQGYILSDTGYDCYTSNSFVTESDCTEAVLYDMELNYIVAFPLEMLGAIKIVSDNLDLEQYENSVNTSEEEIWKKVKELLYSILQTLKE